MTEREAVEKKLKIMDLLFAIAGDYHEVDTYFDVDSEDMLDEKIEVLTALKKGKTIEEIPNFYDILELMPKDGIWD